MDDECQEPNSTPKLILSKLPCKIPRNPIQMLTPPLHPSVSIPFRWEEAPGKPKTTAEVEVAPPLENRPPVISKVARCLDLPPRLLVCDEHKFTDMSSPTTVLEMGRSLSLACTFSFRKGVVTAARDDSGLRLGKKMGDCGSFGSERWGSFREEETTRFGKGFSEFSPPLGEDFRFGKKVKIKRVRRSKRSFLSLSAINSSLWADIYEGLKQVVPWRRNSNRT